MYVLAPNQTVETYPYSIGALRRDNPQVSFPRNPSDSILSNYSVYPVQATTQPTGDVVTEVNPVLTSGQWVQTWSTREFTAEEVAANRASMVVTPRQARLALLGAGLLSNIETAIAAMDDPAKTAVTIEWEYATTIERSSQWVSSLATALSLTDEQLDNLFEVAKTL